MTIQEFSDQFDTLVDGYRREKDFDSQAIYDSIEFSEYEKSVFLTQAQEYLVRQLYTGVYNIDSYEKTEEIRRHLSNLVKTKTFEQDEILECTPIQSRYPSALFALPNDCWYIVYEQISLDTANSCLASRIVEVVPVTHDTLINLLNNPFRGVTKRRALRLDVDKGVEIVSTAKIKQYTIRYVSRPEPIILAQLYDESINGQKNPQTCLLHSALHQDILQSAVKLALASKYKTTTKDSDTDEDNQKSSSNV